MQFAPTETQILQITFRVIVHKAHEYSSRLRLEYRLNTVKVVGAARSVKSHLREEVIERPSDAVYRDWKNASEAELPEVLEKLLGEVRRHGRNVVFNRLAESNEELVELIVRAVRQSLCTFREEAKFSSWVHRIALNHVFQELRRRVRERRVFDYRVEVNDEIPEIRSGNPDLHIWVEQLARGLSEEEQLIYWARYQGYTISEIAKQLGVATKTMESRWRRLIQKIREAGRRN